MGQLSNYLENELLDHVLKVGSFSVPANLYVALSTADPTDTGGGLTEPGNGYARVNHNSWHTASNRATSNDGTVSFPEASGAWGTITHWAILDAASGGNMLFYGALSGSKTVTTGEDVYFSDGDIDVSFDAGGSSTYLANKLLDHVLKVGAYSVPTNIYVALSTANPGDTGGSIAEPGGGSYARDLCNGWDAASGGAADNTAAITFVTATASWGTITYAALFDALSGGNMLFYLALDSSKAVGNGDTAQFAAGGLDVTMD